MAFTRTWIIVVIACLSMGILPGCEMAKPTLDPDENGGLSFSLIFPPDADYSLEKARAEGDTIRAWLFELGPNIESAYNLRPAVGDTMYSPIAEVMSHDGSPLEIFLTRTPEETWYRLFISLPGYQGQTTFPIFPNETERTVFVALTSDEWQRSGFTVYDGFVAEGLSEPGGASEDGTTTIFPVGLKNWFFEMSSGSMHLSFLSNCDNMDVYFDPGSRLFSILNPDSVRTDIQKSYHADRDMWYYDLEFSTREFFPQGTYINGGNDILFYLIAQNGPEPCEVCINTNGVTYQSEYAGVAVIDQADGCSALLVQSPGTSDELPWTDLFDTGQMSTIRWIAWGDVEHTVAIELIHDGEVCETITWETPNDGEFFWDAARCASKDNYTGGEYRVRVREQEGEQSGTGGMFGIMADCSIHGVAVGSGEALVVGQMYPIEWISSGYECPEMVQIWLTGLDPVGGERARIAEPVPNSGFYNWVVGMEGLDYPEYSDTSQFYIEIEGLGDAYWAGASDHFNIWFE